MKIKLIREYLGNEFTEGKLFINDRFECYTIEDKDRLLELNGADKVYGETAIPRGNYRLVISYSARFYKPLIEVKDVSGFSGVRIHSGNSSEDTEGCIIIGSVNNKNDDNWVGGSRVAYIQLHQKVKEALERGELVTLEVV